MFDLLADGKIAIDFTNPDGSPRKVTVNPPPTFGALKRLKAKAAEIDEDAAAFAKDLDDRAKAAEDAGTPDPELTPTKRRALATEKNDQTAVEWWKFTLFGDDTWKGLGPDAPENEDDWPIYMATVESLLHAQRHWRETPLARGGQPVPLMS